LERVERFRPLLKDDYVSKLDFDNYVSQLKESEAMVLEDIAAIEKAQIDLDYCFVKAPFVATASKRLIDKGNLITNAGQNLLLVNQVQPIFVDFSIPEKRIIPVLERQYQTGSLNVHVQPQGTDKIFKGKVLVVGNQINKKTGMVPMRAVFENGDLLLWPGQFSKEHLILDHIEDAVVVPESGVNVGQHGMYSLVVGAGGIAEFRKVKVGLHLDGIYQVISGLEVGETVITNGQINVVPKKSVNITAHDKKWVEKLDHESF
ncbi:MAG: efflux RND transporter periplasmic adaptor subunit, partial [Simkaniaceae bacterium]|nr:efflux RND transporter periplasmic adaptor subunit [Simkaniaceae bacterium]